MKLGNVSAERGQDAGRREEGTAGVREKRTGCRAKREKREHGERRDRPDSR